jgi:hypothetical protein
MCSTTARKSTASVLPLSNVSADAICTSASSHTQSPHRQFSQGSTLPSQRASRARAEMNECLPCWAGRRVVINVARRRTQTANVRACREKVSVPGAAWERFRLGAGRDPGACISSRAPASAPLVSARAAPRRHGRAGPPARGWPSPARGWSLLGCAAGAVLLAAMGRPLYVCAGMQAHPSVGTARGRLRDCRVRPQVSVWGGVTHAARKAKASTPTSHTRRARSRTRRSIAGREVILRALGGTGPRAIGRAAGWADRARKGASWGHA